jgi:predicted RNA-binding Zn-ribbon protein involved in translation (DUF1610 family)
MSNYPRKSRQAPRRPLPTHEWIKLDFKFVCPQCGGTRVDLPSLSMKDFSIVRACSACGFRWQDSDDEKYVFISWKEAGKMRGNATVGCLLLSLPFACVLFSALAYLLVGAK